jgi:hypothetical protein
MSLPFKERVDGNVHVRKFSSDVNDDELVWHRDKEDRLIEIIQNDGWLFQYDNELPFIMEESFFVPKNTFHRVIKGDGDLIVKVKKL